MVYICLPAPKPPVSQCQVCREVNKDHALGSMAYNVPMSSLKEYFLLDPSIVFLNHGSYGAAPKPVFDAYQSWQMRLERQPVLFLGRELPELMHASRTALGEYLNADP